MTDLDIHDHLRALGTDSGKRDPYPLYEKLRAHPPVYDDRHRAYLAVTYDQCTAVLTGKAFGRPDTQWLDRRIPDWRDYPGITRASRTMQLAEPETHTRLRGTVARFFTSRRVNSLIEFESRSVDTLMDILARMLEQGAAVDIQEVVASQIPSISIAALLGIPHRDVENFRRHALALSVLEPELSPNHLVELDDAYATLGAYFDTVISERRGEPRDDLATHLVRCCDEEGSIAPDELMPMFISLYAAGTVNTSNFIGNGVSALLSAPSEADLLRAEPGLATAAVTEVLRYDPPMQVTRRISLTDTELGGVTIPADAEVAVVLGAANRDPNAFTEPDAFRIRRGGRPPLSFGGGAFYCIGAALGRLEGAQVFQKLVMRFPSLRLGEGATHNLRSVLRGYHSLPVTLEAPAVETAEGDKR